MKEVIYSKFCCHRKKEYQIFTQIVSENGLKYVTKKAIHTSGNAHVMNILNNKTLLEAIYKNNDFVEVCKCYKNNDTEITFDYIEGRSFDIIMEEIFEESDIEKILYNLKDFYSLLLSMVTDGTFKVTREFIDVFGKVELSNSLQSGNICNIDMIFSNIIKADKYYITDYEWVLKFPIPINYIFYRSLLLNCGFSKLDEKIKQNVWNNFGIDQYQQAVYLEMERRLQAYIVGQEFSVRCINDSPLYLAVDVNSISWENSGFFIRIYNVKKNKTQEIYSQFNPNENNINIRLDITEYAEALDLKLELVAGNSIIIIKKLAGIFEGRETTLQYRHNAALKIDDILYYTNVQPLVYIDNLLYDFISIEYEIIKSNDSMVPKIIEYIVERQAFREEAENLKKLSIDLKTANESLEVLNKDLESTNKDLESANKDLESANKDLESANKDLESANKDLKAVNEDLSKKLLRVEDEKEYLMNLKLVKFYLKLKGKK